MTPLKRTSNSEAADCGGEETVCGDKDAVAVVEEENAEDEGKLPEGVGCSDWGIGGESDRPVKYEGGENRGGERVKYEGRE